MKIDDASHLSDQELTAAVVRLARGERETTVALIVHLGEFDERRLYEPAGFRSMFRYCETVLHLSEDAVFNRIETARAARRHPVIVDMLLDGRLSPTTARMLARHLTPENEAVLLAAASGKGKAEVEEMIADRCPRPDVRSSVRKLPRPHKRRSTKDPDHVPAEVRRAVWARDGGMSPGRRVTRPGTTPRLNEPIPDWARTRATSHDPATRPAGPGSGP